MDPADDAIHQCVFECVLELPTSCLTQVMDLFASGISILVLLIVSISGLGDSIQAQPCAASMAWKLGIPRTMAVFLGGKWWWTMMSHDEPSSFWLAYFQRNPSLYVFGWTERWKKTTHKKRVPSETPIFAWWNLFFFGALLQDLRHPREKEQLSPEIVLIFGSIGVCFDLISFWGPLALQVFYKFHDGSPFAQAWKWKLNAHSNKNSRLSAANVFCWFTEGIVAAQPRETIDASPLLFARQTGDGAGACAAKSLERIHHSEIQHATQSMVQWHRKNIHFIPGFYGFSCAKTRFMIWFNMVRND